MFVYSTGQVGAEVANVSIIRVDLMNKNPDSAQRVRILVFDTSTSPKDNIYDSLPFEIPPASGDSRTILPVLPAILFPTEYEVVIRTNDSDIVAYITGISAAGTTDLAKVFKHGDLYIDEVPGLSV
jgi:hypothetical protein